MYAKHEKGQKADDDKKRFINITLTAFVPHKKFITIYKTLFGWSKMNIEEGVQQITYDLLND